MPISPPINDTEPIATISIRSSATKYRPYTLVVDGISSDLAGFAVEDVIFSWDFDTNAVPSNTSGFDDETWHPLNNQAKINIPDPRVGNDRKTKYRTVAREVETVQHQKGCSAAYTFYEAGTYTVSLTIKLPSGDIASTSTSVTVLDSSNGVNGWVDKTVGTGGDYTTLAAAITYVNGTAGKVRLNLINGETFNLTSTQTINVSDVIITTSVGAGVYPNPAIIQRDSSWSPGSPSALLAVGASASRVYIEGIVFSSNGQTQSATQIIGIDILGTNVAVHGCIFGTWRTNYSPSYNAVRLSGTPSVVYISQCEVDSLGSEAFNVATGNDVVITGNNVYGFYPSGTPSYTSLNGYLIDYGSSSSCLRTAVQWNALRYNGFFAYPTNYLSGDNTDTYPQTFPEASSKGPIRILQTQYSHVYNNYLAKGSNVVGSTNSNCRWAGNYMTAGGQNAIININGGTSGFKCVNNVCKIGIGGYLDSGPHAVAIYGSGSGSLTNISIINNTFIALDNIRSTQGICRFSANGRTIGSNAIKFYNNAFVTSPMFVSKYIVADSTSIFSQGLYNNVFPSRRASVPVASFGGTDVSYTTFSQAGYQTNTRIETVKVGDMKQIFNFAIPNADYPNAQLATPTSSVMEDFVGTLRTSNATNWSAGAVELAGVEDVDSATTFTCTFYPTSRSNRTDGSLPVGASGFNGYITVTDDFDGYVLLGGFGSSTNPEAVASGDELYLITEDQPGYDPTFWTGSNIQTVMYFTSRSDGFDLRVVYTNMDDHTNNDSNNNLGSIRFESWDMGRTIDYLDSRALSQFSEQDNYWGNIASIGAHEYPNDLFSPCQVMRTKRYAVGTSLVANHATLDRPFRIYTTSNTYPQYQDWHIQYKWIEANPLGGGPSGEKKDKLQPGESFEVTYSVRIVNTPKDWLSVVDPWKDFYASTYGSVEYAKDPRPILPVVMNQADGCNNDNRFGYLTFDAALPVVGTQKWRRPDHYGWEPFYNLMMAYHSLGWDRMLMWCPAGLYGNSSGLNYPQKMFSPFFDSGSPHNQDLIDDAIVHPSTDIRGKTIVYPDEVPTGTRKPIISTLSFLRKLCDEIPTFGFYFGRVSYIDGSTTYTGINEWPVTGDSSLGYDMVSNELLLTDTAQMQRGFDEFDIGAAYFHMGMTGQDAYTMRKVSWDISRMEQIKARLPSITAPGAEVAPPDLIAKISPSYISVIGSDGFAMQAHDLAHYIVPRCELLMAVRFDGPFFYYKTGLTTPTADQSLGIMENYSKLGYTMVHFDNVQIDTPGAYDAVDVTFNYHTAPSDYPTLAAPANFTYSLHNAVLADSTYNLSYKYVKIMWDANTEPDFDHYKIYKAPTLDGVSDPNGTYILRQYVRNNFFYDTSVEVNNYYYYKVKAVDVFGNESEFSEVFAAFFISDDPNLPSPTNVVARVSSGRDSVVITWQ